MFTSKEITFLLAEVEKYTVKLEELLDNENYSLEKRLSMEDRLIVARSVVRKLHNRRNEIETVRTGPASVLVVDDVEAVLFTHKQFLLNMGFKKIETAINGETALKKIIESGRVSEAYELIICDWEMPKMSGLDLLEKVRNHESLWSTPFYLVTGRDSKADMLKAITMGATGYITKPISPAIFEEKLSEYL